MHDRNRLRPWSKIAENVTQQQAETYRDTCVFPIHIEKSKEGHRNA